MPNDAPPPPDATLLQRIYQASVAADLHIMRQAAVLATIAQHPGESTSAIAGRLDMSRTAATRSIAALVEADLATNRIDPQDNRLRIVEPTTEGLATLGRILAATRDGEAQ